MWVCVVCVRAGVCVLDRAHVHYTTWLTVAVPISKGCRVWFPPPSDKLRLGMVRLKGKLGILLSAACRCGCEVCVRVKYAS